MINFDIPNLKEYIEKLNSISKDEYYIYQKSENESFPLILEIKGNIKSPYEGGVFVIEINFQNVKFITKVCSIFININTGEFIDKNYKNNFSNDKKNLENFINFIKDEILITPNDTKLIESYLDKWTGKEIYYKYLSKIKSYTQKYANKDGLKIKVDNNLLSNQDFSEYVNKKAKAEAFNRIKSEINNEIENISNGKSFFDIILENVYFCPFNNLNQIYFEFLGEPDTPYEGGVFQFLYEIPKDYPFRPGNCIFRTKIFHNKFYEDSSKICDYEIFTNGNPGLTLYHICLYYYKMINKYDYICHTNERAKKLMNTNFKEYLIEVKNYVKKFAILDGIKLSPDLKLIEKSPDKLNIDPPIEEDFMPPIGTKELDKNIKEEEINIIAKNIWIKNDIMLKIKNTEFVVDICIKLRNYIIENKDIIKTANKLINSLDKYNNLLPYILLTNQKNSKVKYMEYNKQIGSYDIKNNDKIRYNINFPTCSYNFNQRK